METEHTQLPLWIYPKSELKNPLFLAPLLVAVTRFHFPPPQLQGAILFPDRAIFFVPQELHSYNPDRFALDPDFGIVFPF